MILRGVKRVLLYRSDTDDTKKGGDLPSCTFFQVTKKSICKRVKTLKKVEHKLGLTSVPPYDSAKDRRYSQDHHFVPVQGRD